VARPARSRRNRGYQVGPAGGGPDYEVRYPNGDRVAYVTAVYEAAIINGSPAVRDDELSDIAWFAPAQLAELELSRFARALLAATGYL
jgi:8-oxo-dGTP pyrophosphatase MutT (NUDIX family)